MIVMNIRGAEYADKTLRDLGYKIARRITTNATRAGTNVIRDIARKMAPVDTGLLRKRIGSSVKVNRVSGTAIGTVKGRRTKGQRKKGEAHTNRYLHLVVAGTKAHDIEPSEEKKSIRVNGKPYEKVRHPGSRANPFMDRAARIGFRPSLVAFENKLDEGIIKETTKARMAQPQ